MKNLNKEILRIALPAVTGFLGLMLFDLVDVFWVSKLGTEAVAGVAAAGFLEWIVYSMMGATATGAAALIAQAYGRKNKEQAFQIAKETFHLSILFSLLLTLVLFCSGSSILKWMGLSEVAHRYGLAYFKVLSLGVVVFYLFHLLGQIFNAYGDTKTSIIILTLSLILNAALDPFFIFGWWIFPKWGTFGASFASLLSCALGSLARYVYLRKREYIGSFRSLFQWSSDFHIKILKIGVPTALSHLIWAFVYPLLSPVIARFGMAPLAAVTIAQRIEAIAYFSAYGFSIAMTSLVGQAIGKNNLEEAKVISERGKWLITALLIPVTLVFVFIPDVLVRLLSQDPEVVFHGTNFLRILGYAEIFLGWEMLLEGCFNGLGNTRPYMLISVPLTFGRYPMAYLLVVTFGYGVEAVWWTITISTVLKGILMNFVLDRESQSL